MPQIAHVAIHPSQFPEKVRRDLHDSLRTRRVNHKFHYDTVKQTAQWLALHQAFSPSRTEADCAAVYDSSFAAVSAQITTAHVRLIGLGCGGGQKDTRLLKLLRDAGKGISYIPSDVSTAMVLVARQTALSVIPEPNCFPLVCDLATAEDLPAVLDQLCDRSLAGASRLLTFFGMIPNFEPEVILPLLANLVRPEDLLLFSANLAPGPDYEAGIQKILPQYDNALTRDWLMTFLLDLGVAVSDGDLRFVVERGPAGGALMRVAAYFHFKCSRKLSVDGEKFEFLAGDAIRSFFSYRHTPGLVRELLARHGLQVLDQWITRFEEEGVFLCAKKSGAFPTRP
jgi:uncharacterized SAM-dependent methyltransferase